MASSKRNDMKYIETRHGNFRVDVCHPTTKERKRETFKTLEGAKFARDEFLLLGERSRLGMATQVTVRHAAEQFLEELRTGLARTSEGNLYKPGVQAQYRAALNNHVLPTLGATKLSNVRHKHVNDLVKSWTAEGLKPSTVRGRFMALRVLFRYAIEQEWVTASPCDHVTPPSTRDSKRNRIVTVSEALRVLEALASEQRIQLIYALAFFTGLRRGELQSLRWQDVDLTKPELRVKRSFFPAVTRATHVEGSAEILGWPDEVQGAFVRPKSAKALRTVPLPTLVLPYLARENRTTGLVTGRAVNTPFTDHEMRTALQLQKDAGLDPVTPHEARHTYASCMIAAGVNVKSLQEYMGHSNIATTFDLYGHLMPGHGDEAMDLLNEYLAKASSVTT